MLDKFFSERFIENARSYTHYNFIVMNLVYSIIDIQRN